MSDLAAIREEAAAMAGLANNKAVLIEDRLACADRSTDLFIRALELLDEENRQLSHALGVATQDLQDQEEENRQLREAGEALARSDQSVHNNSDCSECQDRQTRWDAARARWREVAGDVDGLKPKQEITSTPGIHHHHAHTLGMPCSVKGCHWPHIGRELLASTTCVSCGGPIYAGLARIIDSDGRPRHTLCSERKKGENAS